VGGLVFDFEPLRTASGPSRRVRVASMAWRGRNDAPTQACEPDVSSAQLKLLVQRLRREQRAQFRPSGAQHINPAAPVLSPGSAAKDDDVPESAWERKAARAILRLEEQFPGDVGAMAPLFLNYLLIAPGESFFMAANEPHAYVAGEILECMACSDNVVRAGLTPKMKDVDNLVDMLTYSMGGPDIEFGRLVHQGPGTRTLCYTPPVPEFEVLITTVETGATYDIAPCEVPSILICVEGIGHTQSAPGPDGVEPQRKHRYELCPGKSLYITAGTVALTLVNDMTTKGPLRVARARQNLSLAGRAEDSQ